MLLREPRLGAAVPRAFLRSANRIAAGQRVFVLQPIGAQPNLPALAAQAGRAALNAPTRAWLRVNYGQGRITVGIYFSEAEAQQIAEGVRKGRSGGALLKAMLRALQGIGLAGLGRRVQREEEMEFEELAGRIGRSLPRAAGRLLRKRIAGWVLPALSKWTSANAEAFLRAVAHPEPGVTVRARLTGVPGFELLAGLATGKATGSAAKSLAGALRGSPGVAITVTPGRRRK
jgi:hypothetical protein